MYIVPKSNFDTIHVSVLVEDNTSSEPITGGKLDRIVTGLIEHADDNKLKVPTPLQILQCNLLVRC